MVPNKTANDNNNSTMNVDQSSMVLTPATTPRQVSPVVHQVEAATPVTPASLTPPGSFAAPQDISPNLLDYASAKYLSAAKSKDGGGKVSPEKAHLNFTTTNKLGSLAPAALAVPQHSPKTELLTPIKAATSSINNADFMSKFQESWTAKEPPANQQQTGSVSSSQNQSYTHPTSSNDGIKTMPYTSQGQSYNKVTYPGQSSVAVTTVSSSVSSHAAHHNVSSSSYQDQQAVQSDTAAVISELDMLSKLSSPKYALPPTSERMTSPGNMHKAIVSSPVSDRNQVTSPAYTTPTKPRLPEIYMPQHTKLESKSPRPPEQLKSPPSTSQVGYSMSSYLPTMSSRAITTSSGKAQSLASQVAGISQYSAAAMSTKSYVQTTAAPSSELNSQYYQQQQQQLEKEKLVQQEQNRQEQLRLHRQEIVKQEKLKQQQQVQQEQLKLQQLQQEQLKQQQIQQQLQQQLQQEQLKQQQIQQEQLKQQQIQQEQLKQQQIKEQQIKQQRLKQEKQRKQQLQQEQQRQKLKQQEQQKQQQLQQLQMSQQWSGNNPAAAATPHPQQQSSLSDNISPTQQLYGGYTLSQLRAQAMAVAQQGRVTTTGSAANKPQQQPMALPPSGAMWAPPSANPSQQGVPPSSPTTAFHTPTSPLYAPQQTHTTAQLSDPGAALQGFPGLHMSDQLQQPGKPITYHS